MPEKKVLRWLADSENQIPEALRPWVAQQGFEWVAFQSGDTPAPVLLIFSPVWNGQQYLSIEGVWAKYLAKDYPDTQLIVVGNQDTQDTNFVDVLQIQERFAAILEAAPAAIRFATAMPVFTGGMDMGERMKRFLKGHGNESMAAICQEIYFNLSPGRDALKNQPHLVQRIIEAINDPSVKNNWGTLASRWINYQPFFGYLPFYTIFEEIRLLMECLRPWFEDSDASMENIEGWFSVVLPDLKRLESLLKKLEEYVQ